MALEATFRELGLRIERLDEALDGLYRTIGDTPVEDGNSLADQLENAALDAIGLVREMQEAATGAKKAIGHPLELDLARRALTRCQESFCRTEQGFNSNLASYKRLKDLSRLGQNSRWLHWARINKRGIEQCRQPLQELSKALADCWQEIAERVGTTSISVHATSVGQKIVSKASEDLRAGYGVP